MTIKEEFITIIETRERAKGDLNYPVFIGFDVDDIVKVLSKNYIETKDFLKNAAEEEISLAIDALADLVRFFNKEQAQELVALFRQKTTVFPDIQKYCDCDYMEQIESAESYLEEL